MKLSTNLKTIAPMTGMAALLLWGVAGQYQSEGAGSLTPPPGTPTPVMPTLEEIADRLDTLPGSSGKNFALRYDTMVQVWNSKTGLFTPLQTVNPLQQVVESNGNFCALGNQGGSAWSKQTGSWSVVSGIQGATTLRVSNGNFCIVGTNKAAVWSHLTGSWTTSSTISNLNQGSIATSNGSFLIRVTSRVIAWSQTTGTWTEITPRADLREVISAGN
jgi:hypothetical protein